MIAFLWGIWAIWKSSIIKYAIIVGSIVAFLGTVWFKGYSAANRRMRERHQKALKEQIKSKVEINERVKSMSESDVDKQLSKHGWMRDD